jgi:8-oxo-dGTP pyrophosphatase MutT (NUDIX family)
MSNIFEDKYKKYKQKYLDLKKQLGGHKLIPEGTTVTHDRFSIARIPLNVETPPEIIERPIIFRGLHADTFISYRHDGNFVLSNTFFSCSRQVYDDIVQQIRELPSEVWIMCLRYLNKDGSLADCQIGISGAVNNKLDTHRGLINFDGAIRREFEEETGLQLINDVVCGPLKATDNITYVVSCTNIENIEVVNRRYMKRPANKKHDIHGMKVWCVPYIHEDRFDHFKEQLNRHTDKNLYVSERDIASLVFIRKSNLIPYL